jgi:hypothetical protein
MLKGLLGVFLYRFWSKGFLLLPTSQELRAQASSGRSPPQRARRLGSVRALRDAGVRRPGADATHRREVRRPSLGPLRVLLADTEPFAAFRENCARGARPGAPGGYSRSRSQCGNAANSSLFRPTAKAYTKRASRRLIGRAPNTPIHRLCFFRSGYSVLSRSARLYISSTCENVRLTSSLARLPYSFGSPDL